MLTNTCRYGGDGVGDVDGIHNDNDNVDNRVHDDDGDVMTMVTVDE